MENERFIHTELTKEIIGAFYDVYNELGFGFLESIYEKALEKVLRDNGHKVERQFEIPVFFRNEKIGNFKADLIVDDLVIIELKAGGDLHEIHEAQILNYLRATDVEVGLLVNFGEELQFKRRVFSNSRKMNFR